MYLAFIPILVLAIYMARRKGPFLNNSENKRLDESPIKSKRIVGIRNLGHTCYMNAVIQGLYAIESYRNRVLNSTFVDQSIGCEVKRLFTALKTGAASCEDATPLADALQIDVYVQQDSEELFLTLVNGVDDSLATKESPQPSQAIKFLTKQTISCSKVHFDKKKVQSNLDLSVNINGHRTLDSAIHSHFQNEILQIDPVSGVNNQYQTKEHGLQDAVKSLCIVEKMGVSSPIGQKPTINCTNVLPEALVVHLKRFDFDPTTQRMRKLGDPVDIPLLLDLSNVTMGIGTSALNTEDKENKLRRLVQGIDERELSTYETVISGANDAKYELTAVVVHVGTLESGHYYCLSRVKSESPSIHTRSSLSKSNIISQVPDRWVQCNDEHVTEVSQEEVLAQARGTVHPFDSNVSSNAYMLFYTRVGHK